MERIRIIDAKITGNLSVDLLFSDNTRQSIDVGAFILNHPHPQYNKYLNKEEFAKFTLDDGNIVWGEDWDLIFPIEQLHAGFIA